MKKFKTGKFMKLLSFILCIALVLCENSWRGIGIVSAAAAENAADMGSMEGTGDTDNTVDTGSTAVYYGNGYSVTVEISAKWNNGYNANVTIENTSEEGIRSWELVMTDANPVDNIWNAKKLSQEDGILKIGNDGWNQDIAPGSSVSFGFQSLTENPVMPRECYLAGDRQDAAAEDYQIVFRAVNTWEGGCVVETDILNLTDKDIEDWDIAFTWKDIKIADIWNAVIDTENDGSYTITNDTYNSTVPANGKITFGMRLETGTGGLVFPSDARLSRWTGDADASNGGNKTDDKTGDKTDDKTDELRRWNRTMMNMDAESVQEAVNQVDEPVKVAILDSGVDAMPEIPVVERFNLIDGEDEMSEMFEDSTGHGTAVASVMAYHREKEEETGEGTGTEEGNGNTYTYQGYTYEYFTDDIEDIDEYFDFDDTEEEDNETENEEDSTDNTNCIDSEWEDDEDDEEEGEDPEGTIRLGEFVEEHQADFEGINPNMELYSVRLLDDMNEASVSDVIKGIRWSMENDIKIINISFGTQTDSPELHRVIKEAEKKGILIIAAAGNNGEVQYPAAYDEVIAVGSVDYTGKVESECENDTYIELTAPGEGVLAVGPFGVETEAGGTSMAAGEVSAVASILWQHDPTVSNRFIRQLLRAGANKSDNTISGYGIVDCEYSLSIFEDLKTTFVENEEAATDELMEEAGIEENTDELGTEGIVTANWGGKGHLGLIPEDMNGVTGDYLKVLKIGARLPDSALCKLNNKEEFPAWHGYCYTTKFNNKNEKERKMLPASNYVAGYLYLSRLARKINNGGGYSLAGKDELGTIFNKLKMRDKISSDGINYEETENEEEDNKSKWENILKSKLYDGSVSAGAIKHSRDKFDSESEMNRSLVVYGMSLHTMTDTFAHSCFGYGSKKSSDKKTWEWDKFSSLTYKKGKKKVVSANDNKKVFPKRYKAAKQAVINSMNRISIEKDKDNSGYTMTITKTDALDFCSGGSFNDISKKETNNIREHVIYVGKKPNAIKISYYGECFGLMNLCGYVKKCGEIPDNDDEYLKNFEKMDMKYIKGISGDFAALKQDIKISGAKDDTKVSVSVNIRKNGKQNETQREQRMLLSAEGTQNGTVCLGLNKNLRDRDAEYVVEYRILGQSISTVINSDTPFEEPEETDEDTIVLMDTWAVNADIQGNNRMSLSGLVVEAKENGEHGSIIQGAEISMQYDNGENELKSCKTGADGKYVMDDLEPGLYRLTVKREGYLTAMQYLYLDGMSAWYQNMAIVLIRDTEGTGTAEGIIRDSVSLKAVQGLTLRLRKGFNNTGVGEVLKIINTGNEGRYRLTDIPVGYYCIEIIDEKERYIDTYLNVIVTEKSGQISQDGVVSAVLKEDQMRIVLTWDGSVQDLDSHMNGISEYFHVCYSNKRYINSDGKLIAELDIDDTFYYGPETITVYDSNTNFRYSVYNFSGRENTGRGNTVLSNSNATVSVYVGDRLMDIYHVPSGNGLTWNVFSYDGKTGLITPLGNVY